MCSKQLNSKKFDISKYIILIVLLISIIFPLIEMFASLSKIDIGKMLSLQSFQTTILNSITVTTVSAFLSVIVALVSAWLVARCNIKHKKLLVTLLTIPMLIPSISHGTGLVVLLGNNGVLTNLFNLNINIYGFLGIVLGSFLYSFPVAFLMFYDNLQYEDGTVYLSANILGIPRWRQILNITLPYLKKTIIAVFFTTFTLIFTDYGVPLMVGGKFNTLPLFMYNEVIGLLDFGKGTLVGCILMIPAFIAFIIDMINKDNGSISFTSKEYVPTKNKVRDVMAKVVLVLMIAILLLPIFTFIFLTFIKKYPVNISFSLEHITRALDMNMVQYLGNSLVVALLTALVGTFISFATSYLTARKKSGLSNLIHLISMISLAIPGIVLGLAYVMYFKGSIISGTIVVLVMVNSVHFFASPYLTSYNALNKINPNYEAVASTLGIPRLIMIKDVIIPQILSTLLEMFSYFFVNAMVTISAVSFLVTTKTQTLSLMIPNLEAMMLIESISFVSVVILLVNIAIKFTIQVIKNVIEKNKTKGEIYKMELNRKEFDVLTYLEKNGQKTQRDISESTGYSLGTINSTIATLSEKSYISKDNEITDKGLEALEPYKVKRAIFIAAGFGSRLVPLTINSPKPLIRVNGVRMIDTILDAVYAAGIEEVIIVRGYLKEQFDQLLYKYPNIKFIDNDTYNEANNIGSAYKVRHLIQNAYVMEADLVLSNPELITKYQYCSNYLGVKTDLTDDWCFQVNKNRVITKLLVGGRNVYHMYGISYWTEEDGKKLEEDIKTAFELPGGKERYWDQVPLEIMKKNYEVEVRPCGFSDIVEIDSYSDLKKIDKHYI